MQKLLLATLFATLFTSNLLASDTATKITGFDKEGLVLA